MSNWIHSYPFIMSSESFDECWFSTDTEEGASMAAGTMALFILRYPWCDQLQCCHQLFGQMVMTNGKMPILDVLWCNYLSFNLPWLGLNLHQIVLCEWFVGRTEFGFCHSQWQPISWFANRPLDQQRKAQRKVLMPRWTLLFNTIASYLYSIWWALWA